MDLNTKAGTRAEHDTSMREAVEEKKNSYSVYFGWNVKEQFVRAQRAKSNTIRTALFTKRTWIFVALFKQFKKPINLYFLLITLLQFIDDSPKNPILTSITLTALIVFLVVKDLYEDIPRQK